MVNLGKTKVMIFSVSKRLLANLHFYFFGEEIEINTTYTYPRVQFMGPRLGIRQALQPRLNKGYGSLALIERQCFQGQFQDISSKLGGDYQTHNTLWLGDLGTELDTDKLGSIVDSFDLAS
jgi:hypothetical protein